MKIFPLSGRSCVFQIGIDQKNMDTAFAQLTLRIISNQVILCEYLWTLILPFRYTTLLFISSSRSVLMGFFLNFGYILTVEKFSSRFLFRSQKFAAYDKQGKLVAGDPENEVSPGWTLDLHLFNPYMPKIMIESPLWKIVVDYSKFQNTFLPKCIKSPFYLHILTWKHHKWLLHIWKPRFSPYG